MKENDTICAQSFPFTNCDDYLIEVIKSSVDALVSIYGAIPRWGVDAVVGKHVITNVPLSMDPRTAAAATVIIPTGATYSHDVSVPTIDAKLSLSSAFGASLRIMTLGKDKDHIFISMPGGNHEDVASPFYKNLVPYYVNGSYAVIHVDLEQ
jgi:acyl-homoserine lactone acylase PvdQ